MSRRVKSREIDRKIKEKKRNEDRLSLLADFISHGQLLNHFFGSISIAAMTGLYDEATQEEMEKISEWIEQISSEVNEFANFLNVIAERVITKVS